MGHIRLERVSKTYRRYKHRWARLFEWLDPDGRSFHEPHLVLDDIGFEVRPGESVGVIGQNGAGKSTLLKIITGTTRATSGTVAVSGRVAALLELGMGFHPEFTGRQNAAMAGQLLGLTTEQLASAMPEIESFAEIDDYIDQPLRIYSSGMQMRLAFSVATAIRPDILIVDEALAVGDIYFQQKCFERIADFVAQGTTLLFVTHSMGTVLNLCDRAILLAGGRVVHDGTPQAVIDLYQAELLVQLDRAPASTISVAPPVAQASVSQRAASETDNGARPRDESAAAGSITTPDVVLLGARLVDSAGRPTHVVVSGSDAQLELRHLCTRGIRDPHVGFKIRDRYGSVMYETNSYCLGRRLEDASAEDLLVSRFAFRMRLAPGEYTVTAGFASEGFGEGSFKRALSYEHEVLAFVVASDPLAHRWSGVVDLEPTFVLEVGRGST